MVWIHHLVYFDKPSIIFSILLFIFQFTFIVFIIKTSFLSVVIPVHQWPLSPFHDRSLMTNTIDWPLANYYRDLHLRVWDLMAKINVWEGDLDELVYEHYTILMISYIVKH